MCMCREIERVYMHGYECVYLHGYECVCVCVHERECVCVCERETVKRVEHCNESLTQKKTENEGTRL